MKSVGAEYCKAVIEMTGVYSLKVSVFLAGKEEVKLCALNPAQA
jgi:hypothetical protein